MFGKFFEGGGSFWDPLRRKTDYIKIVDKTSMPLPQEKTVRGAERT